MSEENVQGQEGAANAEDILDSYAPAVEEELLEVEGVEAEPEVAPAGNRNNQTGIITVTCGANTNTFGNISGKSITQLRQDLSDVLNIASNAKAIVSGEEVGDDYVLQPGDRVEFVKQSGEKA